jgi:hypothetical protein
MAMGDQSIVSSVTRAATVELTGARQNQNQIKDERPQISPD